MGAEQQRRYLKELSVCLKREGFEVDENDPTGGVSVAAYGKPLCLISGRGGIRYWSEVIDGAEMEAALRKTSELSIRCEEYMRVMEAAPPLKASTLDGDYRLLSEFNGVVLVGHFTDSGRETAFREMQFVTWARGFNGNGLVKGHYCGENYEAAKKDFAVRAGLIAENELFCKEQLTAIYRAIEIAQDRGHMNDLTYDQERLLEETQAQIEELVPDLREQLTPPPEQEPPRTQDPDAIEAAARAARVAPEPVEPEL